MGLVFTSYKSSVFRTGLFLLNGHLRAHVPAQADNSIWLTPAKICRQRPTQLAADPDRKCLKIGPKSSAEFNVKSRPRKDPREYHDRAKDTREQKNRSNLPVVGRGPRHRKYWQQSTRKTKTASPKRKQLVQDIAQVPSTP